MTEAKKQFDLIIIGSGPAGLTASIYASRYKLKHLVIGGLEGGQITEAHLVENYPGFFSIKGPDLKTKFKEHAERFGTEILAQDARGAKKVAENFEITTSDGKTYTTKTLVLTMGMKRRHLDIPGEKEFLGKGVSYCAICDAAFFKNKAVAVIGGSNAAAMASVHLAEFASKVYQIYRKAKLRSEPVWTDRVLANKKIEVIYNTNITEIRGDAKVTALKLDQPYQGSDELKTDGLFIEIGHLPQAALATQLGVTTDEDGYIKISIDGSTNVKGIYAAGDITTGSNKVQQIPTAMGEAVVAVTSAFRYLNT
jgi:thioredoxin reductase (NADPH)